MRIVMDAYEKDALRDIRAWENRKPGAVELALATGLQAMSDTMSSLRGAREVLVALEQALNGMISLYGFDLRLESERLYAMRVLNAASIVKMTPKLAFLGEMHKIAHELAVRRSWAVLHKNLFSRTVTILGKSFGLRVTKAKLAQVVPVAGVFIAGGFNAWFVSEVCLTASMLYRKRFLARAFDDPDLLLA